MGWRGRSHPASKANEAANDGLLFTKEMSGAGSWRRGLQLRVSQPRGAQPRLSDTGHARSPARRFSRRSPGGGWPSPRGAGEAPHPLPFPAGMGQNQIPSFSAVAILRC